MQLLYQVADYFWVEPEPEPEPEPEEKVVLDPTLQAARDAAIKQEVLKSHQHKAKEQENTIARLSMPLKQKVMSKLNIYINDFQWQVVR